jgi:hypothetical protein
MTGNSERWIIGLAIVAWFSYAGYVVWRAGRSGQYTKNQLVAQVVLAITIPFLGPALVHLVLLVNPPNPAHSDKRHDAHDDKIGIGDTGHYPHSSNEP